MPGSPRETDCQTKTHVLSSLRTQLSDLLPRAMQSAIASYRQFSTQITSEDPKQFIAYHNACRAALNHVDTLSKLTRWLIDHDPQDGDAENLQPLLQQARHLLLHIEDFDADDTDTEL